MAERKSNEELATELTIEYLKANPSTAVDQLEKVWRRFYKMISSPYKE